MRPVRDHVREFLDNPLGKAIEWAVYLVFLGVGVYILIVIVRWLIGFVGGAVG
jgi:hypothetical protein